MAFKLYYTIGSQPCRAILALGNLLDLKIERIPVNLGLGEHRTEEFAKMNPMKTVPVMDHDGFCLYESHSIMRYMCNITQTTDPYYPSDAKERALVDQYLDWFHIHVREPVVAVYGAVYFEKRGRPENIKLWSKGLNNLPMYTEMTRNSLSLLEGKLLDQNFLVNNTLTLADLSLALTIEFLQNIDFDMSPYPRVNKWLHNVVYHPCHQDLKKEHLANRKMKEEE
mmetsp:Transcript_4668/g.5278  ORF Transcript_4668/g.5278 Transcript_4668/m.5278 type:complete len:225 (-) Transcript_4668:17-691(-)